VPLSRGPIALLENKSAGGPEHSYPNRAAAYFGKPSICGGPKE
jgi:hypothetical protein